MSFRLRKLNPTDKVSDALRVMHDQHLRNLPVVDDEDRFVGLFGVQQLIRLLLPKAAQFNSGLTDLSFMPDELGELYHRLRDAGQRPVSEYLADDDDLVICTPSTPFPEVLELLYKSTNTSLPVIIVDGEKDKLVGMVSGWDILEKLVINVFADTPDFDPHETEAE